MKTWEIVVMLLIIISLNSWVWIFPKTFINFMRLGKNPTLNIPFYKKLWKEIEKPNYIWFPRIVIGLLSGFMLVIVLWVLRR